MNVKEQARWAKQASFRLASASTKLKNSALYNIAAELKKNKKQILSANRKDLMLAKRINLQKALVKRLALDNKKINEIIEGVREVAKLEDPIGKTLVKTELDKGLILEKITVPIGVIGVIFESRPDALVQISTLCIKSGNAVILKGGSEAKNSNKILFQIIKQAAEKTNKVFKDSLHLAETREDIKELLKLDQYVDLMVPRGSNALVKYIQDNTKIPVLGHADGICHVYVDKDADIKMGVKVAHDTKCQYAAVCNAMETLLVHKDIASKFLHELKEKLEDVELRGDKETKKIINVKKATDKDWQTEYNDLILSIRIVKDTDEAINHINKYGSHHTDAIITKNQEVAEIFMDNVDSSSVLWNCSTRFADGFRYGLGAEVGISTNKIHARGPVGLEGLTIYKFKLIGKGNIVADYASGKKKFTHKRLK